MPGENGIEWRQLKKQKVAKKPMAEVTLTAKRLGEARKPEGAGRPMEAGELEEAGGPEKVRELEEVGRPEEVGEPEEVG